MRAPSAHSSGSPALRKPSITIDGVGRLGQKPFDCELRIETARLRQSEFRLGVVPFRGLGSRQNGVGNIGRVSRVDGTLKLLDRRVKPTPAKFGNAQVHVPDAAERIAGA